MIHWEIKLTEHTPIRYRNEEYIKSVNDVVEACMNYICFKLNEKDDVNLSDFLSIFEKSIEDLPILRLHKSKGEYIIHYNKWATIDLLNSEKQLFREFKLEKILH